MTPTGSRSELIWTGRLLGRALDAQERLAAANVAQRAGVLLAVLLSALGGRARVAELARQRRTVDLLRGERFLDQHERAIIGELQIPLSLREPHDPILRAIQPQLGRLQASQQRLVVGEDADRAHGRERREHLDLLVEHLALGREHFDRELRVGHYFLAASTTSSIVPFRKKADSGTSSCLPSMISSKPLIVSAIGTYAPGVPVNSSATKNGWLRKRSIRRARWTVSLSSSESSSIPRIAMMSCSSL